MGNTIEYFWESVRLTQEANKHWRKGQTIFNVLHELRPDLSAKVRGVHLLDTFHLKDEEDLETFKLWLTENW